MHAPAWRTRRPETHDLHEGTHPAVIVISHALIGTRAGQGLWITAGAYRA
jgi:hypothetical protein